MLAIQSEGSLNKKVRVYKKIIGIQIKEGKERPYKNDFFFFFSPPREGKVKWVDKQNHIFKTHPYFKQIFYMEAITAIILRCSKNS